MMKLDTAAFFSGACLLAFLLQGCGAQRLLVGGAKCELVTEVANDFFTQDILPGMESNLRKQRIYFVVGTSNLGLDSEGDWSLAVDSVLVPMRLRTDENGAWQWSGGRNFYQPVREGVMVTEEVQLNASGLGPDEGSYLIRQREGQCAALALPEVRHIGTVAMP